MAKRKYKKRTTSSNNKRKKQSSSVNLEVVGTIILSILLAVLIYTKSGYAGIYLNDIFGGMVGILKYILPIGTFAIAIKIACKNNDYLTVKLLQYALFLLCIAVVMSVYQISKGNINVNNELSQVVKDGYELGTKEIGGGALGTLAAIPLVKLLGNFGAVILSVGISIMLFVFTFGIDLSNIINQKVEEMQEKKEEKAKNREIEAEELNERRRKRREEKKVLKQKELEQQENEQIKINLNGRLIDEPNEGNKLKKYNHQADDIIPLGLENAPTKLKPKIEKEEVTPDYI